MRHKANMSFEEKQNLAQEQFNKLNRDEINAQARKFFTSAAAKYFKVPVESVTPYMVTQTIILFARYKAYHDRAGFGDDVKDMFDDGKKTSFRFHFNFGDIKFDDNA